MLRYIHQLVAKLVCVLAMLSMLCMEDFLEPFQ